MRSIAFLLPWALSLLTASWMRTAIGPTIIQASTPSNPTKGSVSGRVWCTDTQTPGRFATVILQPISSEVGLGKMAISAPSFTTIAGTDGDFLIQNVPPGRYLALGWLPGYISPLTQLSAENMLTGDKTELLKQLSSLLPHVTVQPDLTSSLTIDLNRGAEIDGTVEYDDGAPLIDGIIHIYARDSHSQAQKEVVLNESLLSARAIYTDSHGRYQVDGLPMGDYIVSASLPARTLNTAGIVSNSVATAINPLALGRLQVYFEGVLRPKLAKPISVREGSVSSGVNIEIPLAKLHSVTGTIVSERDGHAIAQAIVELLYADDSSVVQRSYLGQDESLGTGRGTFRFNYVPNGSYVVSVIDASDDTNVNGRQDGVSSSGRNDLGKYHDTDMPLNVTGDTTEVIVNVPERDNRDRQ